MAKGKTKNLSSRNVVKYLWLYLNSKKYSYVLDWTNKENKEFFVFFIHKKNPMWSPQYLNLFKAMDAISHSKLSKYAKRPTYETECKKRFHSNLQKLCKDGILKDMGKKQIGSSSSKYFYKFLEIPNYDAEKDNETLKKTKGRAKRIEVKDCIQAPYKNQSSHCLCLSIEELNKHLLEKTCAAETSIETSQNTLPRKEASTDLNVVVQSLKNDWEETPIEPSCSRREASTDLNAVLHPLKNDWGGKTPVEFIPSRREASTDLNAMAHPLKRNDWEEKTLEGFIPSRREASTDLNAMTHPLKNDWEEKTLEGFIPSRREASTDLNAMVHSLKRNDWEAKPPVEFIPSRREASTDLNAALQLKNDWEGKTHVESFSCRKEASTDLNAALQFLKNDWEGKTTVESFPSRKEASTDLNAVLHSLKRIDRAEEILEEFIPFGGEARTDLNGQCSNLNENDWMGKWTEMDTFKDLMFPARETCQDFNQDVNQIGNETFNFDVQDLEDSIVTDDMLNFLSGIENSLNLNNMNYQVNECEAMGQTFSSNVTKDYCKTWN